MYQIEIYTRNETWSYKASAGPFTLNEIQCLSLALETNDTKYLTCDNYMFLINTCKNINASKKLNNVLENIIQKEDVLLTIEYLGTDE